MATPTCTSASNKAMLWVFCVLEPTRQKLTILLRVATMLTARLSRPLSQLLRRTLHFYDREHETRPMLLFCSTSLVPVGRRTYANVVSPDKGGDGAKELDSLKSDRLRTVQLNVCSSEEVENAVEIIRSSLEDPEKGMWGLVNNAGISTFGEVEFTSMETYKEVAEVNLWGTVRMTKSFLPLIRRAKGRVVNISSMLGRMANPARSPYCITKFGVEAFSDCLRYEMHPLGVKVSVIEPGNFIAATSLYSPERIQAIASKMWDELPEVVRRDYGKKYFDEKITKMETYCNSGSTDTSPVINAVKQHGKEAEPFPCLPAGVSAVSVGSTNGLGTDGGPEVERAWPGNIPRAGAEDLPGLSTDGHVSEESKSVNGDQLQGMQGLEHLVLLCQWDLIAL
ncbi:hypothetical protein MC885_000839 [Smutsia gigantea]|nr:hypothetical protein MC885_000839 [Smutsia gigantea]